MFFYSEVQLGKLFFWIGVVVVLMVILRIISYSKHRQQVQQARNLSLSRGKEPMVRCAHCGIYLPRSEALMSNQHTWCSLEHAKLGVRN
ncbi:MAG TPA: PP0621 family protein [Paenalcaligenes sp.]|nr:PP0621 family protein [Paenalcaligenes sp.]